MLRLRKEAGVATERLADAVAGGCALVRRTKLIDEDILSPVADGLVPAFIMR